MIKVTTDPSRKLVIAYMSGFLSPDDVQKFSRDERAAVEAMGLGSGEFMLLVNTAETLIQTQEVVAAFQQLITHSKYKARRIAIVRESSLTRMQAERIVKLRDHAAVFENENDAVTWLFDEAA